MVNLYVIYDPKNPDHFSHPFCCESDAEALSCLDLYDYNSGNNYDLFCVGEYYPSDCSFRIFYKRRVS